jgi:hypothetical protein
MNARIGYDLLPDLASLPEPPVVVVQLHVEEPDRSGYVRYVTTRYGNLVDAFSVSSGHLARAVENYDISPSKIRVIPTGVDAEEEFNPTKIFPVEAVQPDNFNILFPGRLAEQKNPRLMVDVIRRVVDIHNIVHVHIVGDGPLESDIRALVHREGLESHFTFHAPSRELARWYAACDLLLMTSLFEGVPYVVYEAMAMELPIVAPALPGNAELMAGTAGVLVDPRDDIAAYVRAVSSLIEDRDRARGLGRAGRTRVLEHFSLRGMGELHVQLYDELLNHRRGVAFVEVESSAESSYSQEWRASVETNIQSTPTQPVTVPLFERPIKGLPLVSVVVPCFNHGRYLPDCINAILEQDYEAIEVIIVDDASSDHDTIRVLKKIESHGRVRVIYQAKNAGPSAARNRAVKEANGAFILPVDSDNILLPGAVTSLVGQLQSAGGHVQYIYPNCQYFGTRDDYFQPPSFNLALLLGSNYCDTCSLIDRAVFDAGLYYAEDIVLGHEDWDFALALSSHGLRGEPARDKTLLSRKHGFTRSDTVEYASSSFHEELPKRHPELFGSRRNVGRFGRWQGPAAEIKATFAPGLSIVMTSDIDFSTEVGERLLRRLDSQSCLDVELIVECAACPVEPRRPLIRRIPPGLCANEVDLLRESLLLVRANRILLVGEELMEMLIEPSFVEMLQRTFWASPTLEAIAFVDGGQDGRFPYRLLEDCNICRPAHALAWRVEAQEKLPGALRVREGALAEFIARMMSVKGIELQWRHAPSDLSLLADGAGAEGWIDLDGREGDYDPHRRAERRMLAKLGPALPALQGDAVRRWQEEISWMPPETDLLTRHRELDGERRIVKVGRLSPPGFTLERYLGAIQRFAPPGTIRLVQGEHGIRTVERGSPRSEDDEELGHLELSPLPLFQAVERAVLSDGSESIAAGESDGLRSIATRLDFLGFIEAFPNAPALAPDVRRRFHGTVTLLRCVDWTIRRHVYRIGSPGGDELVGELGALHLTAEPSSIAVWIDDDRRIVTQRYMVAYDPPDIRQLLRWVAAPVRWLGFGHVRGRTRAIARRGLEATRMWRAFGEQHGLDFGKLWVQARSLHTPVGYLYPEAAPGRRELFAAIHSVTGDQLLTHNPLEAADMGYGAAVSLGYVLEQAPVTGTLAMPRVSIPWASRFGLEIRR